jgi:hypothetical protein
LTRGWKDVNSDEANRRGVLPAECLEHSLPRWYLDFWAWPIPFSTGKIAEAWSAQRPIWPVNVGLSACTRRALRLAKFS